MEQIIRAPDDFHLHLRQNGLLAVAAPISAAGFARVLVMPNIVPPVTNVRSLQEYRREITKVAPDLDTLMTFKIIPGLEPEEVPRLKKAGAPGAKYYPAGATTNAEDGFSSVKSAFEIFKALEEEDLILSIHGEDPDAPVFEREAAFLPEVQLILDNFPRLRIVLEHISCRASVEAVRAWPERLGASITAHHLAFSVEDLLGGRLNHNLFCKPVVKSRDDCNAVREAAVSGEPRFFFGSDSAPHTWEAKAAGAAGAFSSPVALSLTARVFESAGKLDRLEDFVSRFGAGFYRLPLNTTEILLKKDPWIVPDDYSGLVPLCAGELLEWRFLKG